MTVLAALSALALSVTPVAPAASAQASPSQTAPAASSVAAGTLRPRVVGLAPATVIAWLGAQGATTGALQEDQGRQFVRVDVDGLAWLLFFQSCENGLCSDVQFSTGAANAAITPEMINGWNRDRRFLKAVYEAPEGTGPAQAVIQYDVLLGNGGPEQLADHLAIWRGLLPEFARLTNGAAATAAPAQ